MTKIASDHVEIDIHKDNIRGVQNTVIWWHDDDLVGEGRTEDSDLIAGAPPPFIYILYLASTDRAHMIHTAASGTCHDQWVLHGRNSEAF